MVCKHSVVARVAPDRAPDTLTTFIYEYKRVLFLVAFSRRCQLLSFPGGECLKCLTLVCRYLGYC